MLLCQQCITCLMYMYVLRHTHINFASENLTTCRYITLLYIAHIPNIDYYYDTIYIQLILNLSFPVSKGYVCKYVRPMRVTRARGAVLCYTRGSMRYKLHVQYVHTCTCTRAAQGDTLLWNSFLFLSNQWQYQRAIQMTS